MATQKPDLTRVWANGAPPGNVVDPDTTTPGKVLSGWQAEVPPFEHFNFLQKWFTQGLAHFNEQGIGVWDADTTYPVGGLAKGSDGHIYKAVSEQSGNDPISNPDKWSLLIENLDYKYSVVFKEDNQSPVQNMIEYKIGGEVVGTHIVGNSYVLWTGERYIVEPSGVRVTKGDETLTGGLIAKLQTRNSVKSLGYTLDQETNYAEPYYELFKGLEYGYHLTNRVFAINGSTGLLKCVHSGDSTTNGDSANGFNPSTVMQNFADAMGIMSTHINAGHSGQSSVQWLSTYVDQDIASHPDMDVYFARWGINDGSEHGDADLFESNLRACLTKLRAFKSVADLTIVLMSPSSTYDIPNNRGPEWYDDLAGRIKQVARDFFCVYVDTYAMLRDSKNAAGIWMDDPFGDGRAIHPYAETNVMMYHQVAHHLFSPAVAMGTTTNRFTNAKADSFTPQFTVLPSQYNRGISMFRATLAAGWPLDGFVKTVKSADNICLQTLVEYTGIRRVWTRVGSELPSNAWGDWERGASVKITVPYTGAGGPVSGFEPLTVVEENGVVTLLGATTATGDVTIANIPAGYRPRSIVGAVAKSQDGVSFLPAFVTISTNGNIDISSGWGDGNNININCSWLIA